MGRRDGSQIVEPPLFDPRESSKTACWGKPCMGKLGLIFKKGKMMKYLYQEKNTELLKSDACSLKDRELVTGTWSADGVW